MRNAINTRVYHQNDVMVFLDGRKITGLMEGTSITFTYDGGEVDKTQGTDGPGLNVATRQGGTLRFTLRENSTDYAYLQTVRRRNEASPFAISNAVVTTGTRDVLRLSYCAIGLPGERATGDKKMAGVEFSVVGLEADESPSVV